MSGSWFHVFVLAAYALAFQQQSSTMDSEWKFWIANFICWMCLSASAALALAITIARSKK